ncbi:MAG: elongation factor G, partial [Methylobacteriaceae bacterium]|nr:elongation factor G [Methylobacteriaceae bacterium]
RTSNASQGGKLTIARVLRGSFKDSDTVTGSNGGESRIAGLNMFTAKGLSRIPEAVEGVAVGFSKLDAIATGEAFTTDRNPPAPVVSITIPQPVYAFTLKVKDRKDDVRLSSGLAKLIEEDPSLIFETNPELGEVRLLGQGEMHLRVTLERLLARYQVAVDTRKPKVGYRETIKQNASARGRHKKQSGGHGQFGDVVLEVKPLPRGEGVQFNETITGGVVPRNYIPSVETGVLDYVKKGPLGFPVVDVAVTLTDGSYHPVDSSDAAFQMAARIGMSEAMSAAKPVLLEPILSIELSVPSDATSKATALVSERRGQILGFDGKPDWEGWDVVNAYIPESEVGDLIIKLRSATAGSGSFTTKFHHMEELSGKAAETVVAEAAAAAQQN